MTLTATVAAAIASIPAATLAETPAAPVAATVAATPAVSVLPVRAWPAPAPNSDYIPGQMFSYEIPYCASLPDETRDVC